MATEIWTYGGERVVSGGKRGYGWVDASGKVLYYSKIKGNVIGGCYEMNVERSADNVSVRGGVGSYVGQSEDMNLRRELELEHRSARNRLDEAARERNAARQSALDEATAPLVELARKCAPMQREALLAYVIRRVTSPW